MSANFCSQFALKENLVYLHKRPRKDQQYNSTVTLFWR